MCRCSSKGITYIGPFPPLATASTLLSPEHLQRSLICVFSCLLCRHHFLQLLFSLFGSQSNSVIKSCKSLGWNIRCVAGPLRIAGGASWDLGFHWEVGKSSLSTSFSTAPPPPRVPGQDTTLESPPYSLWNVIGNYMCMLGMYMLSKNMFWEIIFYSNLRLGQSYWKGEESCQSKEYCTSVSRSIHLAMNLWKYREFFSLIFKKSINGENHIKWNRK